MDRNLIRLQKFKEDLNPRFYKKLVQSIDYIVQTIPDVVEIYLFGSCARNETKWDSDIDIAIITKEPITDHELRGNIECSLEEESEDGVTADVIFRYVGFKGHNKTFETLFEQDKKLVWRNENG